MGAFKSAVITTKGQALLAKAIMNTADLEFTKIAVSENKLTGDLATKTGIGTIKQSVLVSSVDRINNSSVKVSASMSNETLTSGYYIRNIGLYAKDSEEGEILYSISVADESTATADWMPPFNGIGVSSLMVDLITVVGKSDNVKIEVDPTAVATVAQINEVKEHLTALDNSIKKVVGGTLAEKTSEGGLKVNKLLGHCPQATTTGAQLLPYPYTNTTLTTNGISFTDNGDGTITAHGTATEEAYFNLKHKDSEPVEGQYYLSCGVGTPNYFIYAIGADDETYMGTTAEGILLPNGFKSVSIKITKGTTVNNVVFKPMINTGTKALPFEAYTDGIPSPSPAYPQKIAVNGKEGQINHTVYGGNLLDYSKLVSNGADSFNVSEDGYTIKATGTKGYFGVSVDIIKFKGKQICISLDDEYSTNEDLVYLVQLHRVVKGNNVYTTISPKKPVVINITEDTTKASLKVIGHNSSNELEAESTYTVKGLRITALQDTPWEPYKATQSLVTTTPNGIVGIKVKEDNLVTYEAPDGTKWCADEVDYVKGKRTQRIASVIFDGTESWIKGDIQYSKVGYTRFDYAGDKTQTAKADRVICTHAPYNGYNTEYVMSAWANEGSNGIRLMVPFNTLDEFKAFLADQYAKGTPVTVYYILSEPVESELTDEELRNSYALRTNDPTTSILADCGAFVEVEVGTNPVGGYTLENLLLLKAYGLK